MAGLAGWGRVCLHGRAWLCARGRHRVGPVLRAGASGVAIVPEAGPCCSDLGELNTADHGRGRAWANRQGLVAGVLPPAPGGKSADVPTVGLSCRALGKPVNCGIAAGHGDPAAAHLAVAVSETGPAANPCVSEKTEKHRFGLFPVSQRKRPYPPPWPQSHRHKIVPLRPLLALKRPGIREIHPPWRSTRMGALCAEWKGIDNE